MTIKEQISKEANPPTFQKLFRGSAVARILDFLTLYKDFDYSKKEISKYSGVAWKTLYRIWPILEQYDLIVKTRRIGRAEMHKLNTENPVNRALMELAFQISKYDAEIILKKERVSDLVSVELDKKASKEEKVIPV
jgi:hypothetical protein